MTSDPESLHREIDQLRQELAGVAPDEPRRRALLSRLGAALWTRADRYGQLADLEEVISVGRQLLALTPPGDPWRSRVLADLGQALMNLFHRSGGRTELDPAIELLREAVTLTPFDHPNRERYARRLSGALGARFDRSHGAADGEVLEVLRREIEQHEIARDRAATERMRDTARRDAAEPGYGDAGSWDAIEEERGPTEEERARSVREPFFGGLPEAPPPPAPPAGPAAPAGPPSSRTGPPPSPAFPPPSPGGLPAGARAQRPAEPAPAARAPLPDLGRIPQPGAPAAEPAGARRLEFAAAYQRAVSQDTAYPFLFYVHRPGERDAVRALIERRAPQLGGQPSVSRGEAAKDVRTGTTLTIVPSVLGATFEPSRLEVAVGDSLRELTFQTTVPGSTGAGPIDGYVNIFVGALIIGQVPVAFEVQAATAPVVPVQSPGRQAHADRERQHLRQDLHLVLAAGLGCGRSLRGDIRRFGRDGVPRPSRAPRRRRVAGST